MYLHGFWSEQAPPSVRTRIGRLPALTTKFITGMPFRLTNGDCPSNRIRTRALVLIMISVPASVTRVSGCEAGGSDGSSGTTTSIAHAGGHAACWAKAGRVGAASTKAAKKNCDGRIYGFII